MLLRLLATFLYVCSTGFAVCVGAATEEDFLWGHIPLTNSKHKALVCKVNVVTPKSYQANRRKYLERERERERDTGKRTGKSMRKKSRGGIKIEAREVKE